MATAMGTGTARKIKQLRKAEEEINTETIPMEDRIRQRAHEIWLARGGNEGSELADWLEAENEIAGT